MNLNHISKFMSLILRHRPEAAALELDENGWIDADVLIEAVKKEFPGFNRQTLNRVVSSNDKQRFAFSNDGTRIRASQGHSIEIDLALEPKQPPAVLYHGTDSAAAEIIQVEGVQKRARQHVHLSPNPDTAKNVGSRHGKPVIFEVAAERMFEEGYEFFLSANGVWLTDFVPAEYLSKR